MTANAATARFDPTQQHLRAMIAKVHIAKAQLRMTDDDYAAVLLRETGHTSSKKCNQAELAKWAELVKRSGAQVD